ncbi:MAG TPA: GNAT family N-acetyltransferase [Ktedonobacterales bacterium]
MKYLDHTELLGQAAELPPEAARLDDQLTLRDGNVVRVRAIRADDDGRLCEFHRHLSPESITYRFFHFMPELPANDAKHFTHVDYHDRMALVATIGEGATEAIIGVVRYDRIDEHTAEVAFVVADKWQGHGIATALLHRLAAYARALGFSRLIAITMDQNARMVEVLHHSGFPWTACYREGSLEVHLDITQPPVMRL